MKRGLSTCKEIGLLRDTDDALPDLYNGIITHE
jgi:hypothetical protein